MADKTIKQVKQAKIELEEELKNLFNAFELENKVVCNYTNIRRVRPKTKKGYDQPEIGYDGEGSKRREIKNVEVRVDFDVIF